MNLPKRRKTWQKEDQATKKQKIIFFSVKILTEKKMNLLKRRNGPFAVGNRGARANIQKKNQALSIYSHPPVNK
jgi:hypothetical protein